MAFIDNLKEMAKKDISHISIKRELLYFEGVYIINHKELIDFFRYYKDLKERIWVKQM